MPDKPVCDYEGSDYQASFWEQGGREYEDRVEAIALERLLPKHGRLMLEVGAGAGRNTPRYGGFERIVLLDYATTQLEQAQSRLGKSDRYVYVAADAYHLPFVEGLFDAATMIRVLHHMVDAPASLEQVRDVLRRDGIFILEFANKRNAKSILRYWLGRQSWSPFGLEPVEFAKLNYDFHPATVRRWLVDLGFSMEKMLTVSHFRSGALKRLFPLGLLVFLDSLLQWTGVLWQLTPSVFAKARRAGAAPEARPIPIQIIYYFKCPACGHRPLHEGDGRLGCENCGRQWPVRNGIFDFRRPAIGEPATAD